MPPPQPPPSRARAPLVIALCGVAAIAAFLLLSRQAPDERAADAGPAVSRAGVSWYCTMTQCGVFNRPAPGKCPKCGMDLVPTDSTGPAAGPREYIPARDARELLRVETVPAERRAVAAVVQLNGKVTVDETRRAVITARFAGRLERLYVDFTGVSVRQGDHMVDIYAPDLIVSQAELLNALRRPAPDRSAAHGLGRYQDRDIEDARGRLRNWGLSDGQIAEIEKRDQPMDSFTINAPIGGVVTERMAVRGQYVSEGTPLFAIGDFSRVWVELSAYEADLAPLRFGQAAAIRVPALPGREFAGVIAFIDPVLDERARAVRVRLDVPNPDGALKPGMLAKARVEAPLSDDGLAAGPDFTGRFVCPMHPLETGAAAADCPLCGMKTIPAEELGLAGVPKPGLPLVIPSRAMLSTGRRTIVYVEKHDGDDFRYEAREIEPGAVAGPWRVVRSGLAEGERVAAQGNFQIDSALQIQGKFSLMSADADAGASSHAAAPRDPYFGQGGHGGDPQPGWYAADSRLNSDPRAARPDPSADALIDAYLPVAEALARDDDAAAARAAQAMASLAAAVRPDLSPDASARETAYGDEYRQRLDDARARAQTLAAAGDLAARRLAFRDLSGALAKLTRRFGAPEGGLRLIFCPMAFDHAGAFWLQRDPTVNNPYHGLEMPRCGWEVEIIP